jgi:hypothetical protein
MTGAWLATGGAVALLLLLRSQGARAARPAGVAMVDEKSPGILDSMTPRARAAADALGVLATAEGIPVTWTSGRRSARAQAAAMIAKLDRGEDLRALYRSAGATLDKLLAAPRTVDAWAPILEAAPISAHQRGDAGDVRRWDLSAAQLRRLGELAIQAGWRRALLESDHLHLQL